MVRTLPLEVWETVLEFCDQSTQYALRTTCTSWKEHIDRRILPESFTHGEYVVPDVSILLFNGFHQYRNNQSLIYSKVEHDVYHPYKESTQDYALFNIVDPLRYFKLNRMEDVDDLHIVRRASDVELEDCELKEVVIIRKEQLRREVLIGPDGQSLMVPLHLLCKDNWELQVPVTTDPIIDGVSVSIYGMGTPNQTWSTTFMSGANLPF